MAQGLQDILAVVNTAGEVWDHTIDQVRVTQGQKMQGPSAFGGSYQFVIGDFNGVSVVTKSGDVWVHVVQENGTILPGVLTRNLSWFDVPVVAVMSTVRYEDLVDNQGYLIVDVLGGVSLTRTNGQLPYMEGPTLSGGPNKKYFVFDPNFGRVMVINTNGEVWAHDLMPRLETDPGWGKIGSGYKLNGPSLFGAPDDKYVVTTIFGGLLVINTAGEVWARSYDRTNIGSGHKLDGPGLFGAPDDVAVVSHGTFSL